MIKKYVLNSSSCKNFLTLPVNAKYVNTKLEPDINIKKIIIYWMIGVSFQKETLLFFVEKPPVAIVLIEWLIASNNPIPAILKRIVSNTVRPK